MRTFAFLLIVPSVALAQPPQTPVVPVIKLTVSAVAEPVPVLRYELQPNFREQVPGNAALSYHRAILLVVEKWPAFTEKIYERDTKINEMCDKPAKEIKIDELQAYIRPYHRVLRELESGAKRDRCDWDLERRADAEGFAVLLDEVHQKMRQPARLLSIRCRLYSAEGKIAEAIRDVQTGFTMARQVGEGSSLIQALVGMSIFQIFSKRLEQILEEPGCPNLYWALTSLPRPFHDMRKPLEGEIRMLDGTLPLLKDLEKGPMTSDQVQKAIHQLVLTWQTFGGESDPAYVNTRLMLAGYITLQFPNAKQSLLRFGKTEAELSAMPAGQVVLLDAVLRYKSLRDELFVWFYVPYAEAGPGLRRVEEKMRKMKGEGAADIFGSLLVQFLPAVEQFNFACVRTERKIAILRTIESLRLHAAANGGKFPEKLADISLVPVPADPATDRPFEYELTKDGKALLSAPPPKGQTANSGNTLRYELTLRK